MKITIKIDNVEVTCEDEDDWGAANKAVKIMSGLFPHMKWESVCI